MPLGTRCRQFALVLTLVLVGTGGASAADPPKGPRVVRERSPGNKVITTRGPLTVEELEFEDGGHTNQISLNGKLMFEEPECRHVFIVGRYPEQGPARILLMELASGGSFCPAYYKIAEVMDDGTILRTDKFGTCSQQAKPTFKNGVLWLQIPKFDNHGQSWMYQDGKLSRTSKRHRRRH